MQALRVDDVLLRILTFVSTDARELLGFAFTCRQWKGVLNNSGPGSIWHSVAILRYRTRQENVVNWLEWVQKRQATAQTLFPVSNLRPIENCSFDFRCPFFAEMLTPVVPSEEVSAGTLYCSACEKYVYHVSSQEEVETHVGQGNCVYFSPKSVATHWLDPLRRINVACLGSPEESIRQVVRHWYLHGEPVNEISTPGTALDSAVRMLNTEIRFHGETLFPAAPNRLNEIAHQGDIPHAGCTQPFHHVNIERLKSGVGLRERFHFFIIGFSIAKPKTFRMARSQLVPTALRYLRWDHIPKTRKRPVLLLGFDAHLRESLQPTSFGEQLLAHLNPKAVAKAEAEKAAETLGVYYLEAANPPVACDPLQFVWLLQDSGILVDEGKRHGGCLVL